MPGLPDLGTGRARSILTALAAVVLVILGYLGGLVTPQLTAPGDDSAEAGFARDMTVHHAQAVRMALLEYDRGDPSTAPGGTLHRMAYDIATSQQYQMGMMETWLRGWGLQPLSADQEPMAWVSDGHPMTQADGRMPGMASADEMSRLEKAVGKDADILFCQLMIRHHLGGIHMINSVLKQSSHDDVVELAENMRRGQQGEIDQLRLLLKDLGGAPV